MNKAELRALLSKEEYSNIERASEYIENKSISPKKVGDFLSWLIIPLSIFTFFIFGVVFVLNLHLKGEFFFNLFAILLGAISYFVPDQIKQIPYILYKSSFIFFTQIFLFGDNPIHLKIAILSLSSLLGMTLMFSFIQIRKFFKAYLGGVRNNLSRRISKIIKDFHVWNKTEIRKHLDKINPRYWGKIYALYYVKTKEFFYVGQTHRNIKKRISEHQREKDFLNDFDGVLIEDRIDIMDLDDREIFWIKEYSKKCKLINKTSGGSALWKRTNSKWVETIDKFEKRYEDFYK